MYKHKLLVATSMIIDPIFSDKVVFVLDHNEKRSFGITLNSSEIGKIDRKYLKDLFDSPSGKYAKVKELILDGDLKSIPLFSGGPCPTPGIFFLHGYEEFLDAHENSSFDFSLDETSPFSKMKVTDGLYFGTSKTFGDLIEAGKFNEGNFKFFSGMSLWTAGQLDFEIKSGAWTVVDATTDILFDVEKINKLLPTKDKYPWMPQFKEGFDSSLN